MEKNLKNGIALFSGGLDSILAIKLMEMAGFNIIPLFIYTPFHSRKLPYEIKDEFETLYKEEFAGRIIFHKTGEDYLYLVQHPSHGYGKNLNPCIDCKIYFLKIAARYMKKTGASFVVTGEVLGQRGMSQRKDAILKIEKQSGLMGKVVRPLSLPLFPELEIEEIGLLKRDDFPIVKGRDRKVQLSLAKNFGLYRFPQPSGGCLLTDPLFSARLRVLISEKLFEEKWIYIVKYGRFIQEDGIYIVARNNEENEKLLLLKRTYEFLAFIPDFKGPIVVPIKGTLKKAESLSCRYSRHCS